MGTAEEGILMRLAPLCLCLLTLLPDLAAAQATVRFPPPSLRVGEFRADLRVRLHFDVRGLDSDPIGHDDFIWRRARLALEGRIYDDLEYEVDVEARDTDHPWRDVLLNYRRFEEIEVQGGRFKLPFGRDQLTSVFANSFISRSLIGSQLSPGRDVGVMAHGRFAGGKVNYAGGWFRHDGDNARFSEDLDENEFAEAPVDGTLAGRLELAPWEATRGLARRLSFGVNATDGEVAEGLFGLRGRMSDGFVFFEPVYVSGHRIRLGVDGLWTPGPFSVAAEYNRVTDQRNGQGLSNVDLPNVIAQGWYVAGTWVMTGEGKSGGVEPGHPFPLHGAGAFEVVARIEEFRFSSKGTGGEEPFTNPRAANILPNRDRALTLGGNWYLNRFGRIAFNAVRETIQDPLRSPLPDRTRFWSGTLRFQFVM
jgi:phosphate-selective porin OprO and OprP